jgi:hypothetical protein
MGNWIASFFASALEAIPRGRAAGQSSVASAVRSVVRAPLKAIAAFLFAPFLVLRVARIATDSKRRWVAAVGLFVSAVLALAAGTLLGTLTGTFLIAQLFGWGTAIGFLVGTTFSVILTVTFQVLVLNATCFLFLGLSSGEVVEYLKSRSE